MPGREEAFWQGVPWHMSWYTLPTWLQGARSHGTFTVNMTSSQFSHPPVASMLYLRSGTHHPSSAYTLSAEPYISPRLIHRRFRHAVVVLDSCHCLSPACSSFQAGLAPFPLTAVDSPIVCALIPRLIGFTEPMSMASRNFIPRNF